MNIQNPFTALRGHGITKQLCRHIAALLLIMPTAQAQLALPALPAVGRPASELPQLPMQTQTTAHSLDGLVSKLSNELDSQSEHLLRQARVRLLLRENPRTVEADPNGAPVLKGQVVSIMPSVQGLEAAQAAGFAVLEDQDLNDVGLRVVTLQAPTGMSVRRALQRLRSLDRSGQYDYNHLYTQSGEVAAKPLTTQMPARANEVGARKTVTAPRIGLIDGGVQVSHPVFAHSIIHTWGCAPNAAVPSAHGTAVASLLIGDRAPFAGSAPGASLYAADVYCEENIGGGVTRLARALGWLAREQVPVINISLVGPDNALLKQLIANLIARGYVLVAAVGNDGPAAPPLYPASYPGVVGVTAVDAEDRVLVEAGRGKQVRFAAPGAEMVAASLNGDYVAVRGTSFAAPLVAGLLTKQMTQPQMDAARSAIEVLSQSAHDLGPRGLDTTYGYGVVGESLRVAPETVKLRPVQPAIGEPSKQSQK